MRNHSLAAQRAMRAPDSGVTCLKRRAAATTTKRVVVVAVQPDGSRVKADTVTPLSGALRGMGKDSSA